MRRTLLPSLILCLFGTPVLAQTAPPGWSARPQDGGTLYQPNDLPADLRFDIWVPPPSSVGGAGGMQAFMQIKREGLRGIDVTGLRPQCADAEVAGNGSISQGCQLLGGRQALTLQYMMLPVRAGQAHWLRVAATGTPARLTPYTAGLGPIADGLAQRWKDAGAQPAATPSTPPAAQAMAKPAAENSREAVARAIRTAPGRGVPARDIETVLFTWDQVYRVSGLQYEETIYLLMKDGSAYEELALPPEDFDAAASRRLQPDRWKRWRRSGDKYEIQSSRGEWEARKGRPALPGARDQRLAQTFTNHWYASYGGLGGAASQSSFVFKADGRFEQVGRSSYGTGTVQAGNGFAAGATSTHDRTGSQGSSTVSATGGLAADPAVVGGGSTNRRNDGAAFTGRYRIDGWTIELQRDNGEVERRLFLFTGDRRDAVNIGGTAYSVGKG